MKKITVFSFTHSPFLPITAAVLVSMLSVSCLGLKSDKTVDATSTEAALVGEPAPVAEPAPELKTPALVIGENASEYEIVSGDSLSVIAQKNGTTVSAIKAANNLTSDKIVAGKKLIIPGIQKSAGEDKELADTAEEAAPTVVDAPESKLSILEKSDEEIEKASEGVRRAEAPDMTGTAAESLSPRSGAGLNSDPVAVPPAPSVEEDFISIGQ